MAAMGYHRTCAYRITLRQSTFPLSLLWPHSINALSPSLTFHTCKNYKEMPGPRLYRPSADSSFILPEPHTPFSVGRSPVLKDASQRLRNKHTLLRASLVLSRRFSASCTDCCTGRRVGCRGVADVRSEKHLHCRVPTSHDNLLPKLGWSACRLPAGCASEIKRKGRAKDGPQCLCWKEQRGATGQQSCCPCSSFHTMT